jgi:large-conductance mechanosensitive channel
MTHWQIYNTFERLTFILGCLALAVIAFIVLLTIIAVVLLAIDKIQRDIKKDKERNKLAASRPVNAWWSYDCRGRIKEQGKGLRRETRDIRRVKGI